jgi:hypothetical protein
VRPSTPALASAAAALVTRLLGPRYPYFGIRDDGQIGWEWRREEYFEELVQSDSELAYRIPAGAVPYIRDELRRHGYRVTVEDQTPEDTSVQQMDPATDVMGAAAVVNAVINHGRGQLRVSNLEEAVDLIANVLLNFPHSRPILFAATNDEARELASRLKDVLCGEWTFPNDESQRERHMPVVTMQLPRGVGLTGHRLLLYYGWPVVRSKLTLESAARTEAKRFAILTRDKPPNLSLREQLRIAALVGGVVYDSRAQRRH